MSGFKEFAVGEVLTAGDVNTFLMQQAVALETIIADGTDPVSFTSINTNFRHLWIVGSGSHDDADGTGNERQLGIRFNSDSGTNYHKLRHMLSTTGLTTESGTNEPIGGVGLLGNTAGEFSIQISAYRSNQLKTARGQGTARNSVSTPADWMNWEGTFIWDDRSAIDRIDLFASSGDQIRGNTVITLYGLA